MKSSIQFGLLSALLLASAAHAGSCESLKELKLPDTVITAVEAHEAGHEQFDVRGPPGVDVPPLRAALPAYCRVTGSIRPTSDSDIRFELWMPAEGWNHRYEQLGNGGLAGAIPVTSMISPLQRGWAVAGTDDGHVGNSMSDGRWAAGHPQKVIDYGYRAVHLTAARAQAIVKAYYRAAAKHRYFVGCSDGGRESLMEAQRFPEDFDGFLAGAPAKDTSVFLGAVWRAQVAHRLGASRLTRAQMQRVVHQALETCDAADAVKDGVIANPRRCEVDAATLDCANGAAACLSATQVQAIHDIYAGPHDAATGRSLAFGMADTVGTPVPGLGENDASDPIAEQVFTNIVYGAPTDILTLDLPQAERDLSGFEATFSANSTDLSALKKGHKKLLQYHGWADPLIPAQLSLAYFDGVQQAMGDTQDFYRLFLVPGMGHCGGGEGPTWVMGDGVAHDAGHDAVQALVHWVEDGIAPDQIIATEFEGPVPDPMNGPPAGTPVRSTRPVCRYPMSARYDGHGNSRLESGFTCER